MGYSRQEYWSGLPCPPPGDLPNPGIQPETLMFPALAFKFFTTSAAWEAQRLTDLPAKITAVHRGTHTVETDTPSPAHEAAKHIAPCPYPDPFSTQ